MSPQSWRLFENTERTMAVSYGVIAAILVFGGLGYVLDRTLGTMPWLTLSGLVAGFVVGFYALRTFIKGSR